MKSWDERSPRPQTQDAYLDALSPGDLVGLLDSARVMFMSPTLSGVMDSIVHQAGTLLKAKDVLLYSLCSTNNSTFLLHRFNSKRFDAPRPRIDLGTQLGKWLCQPGAGVLRLGRSSDSTVLDFVGQSLSTFERRPIHSLAATALRDPSGTNIAVLKVMDKISSTLPAVFSDRDEGILMRLAVFAGSALYSAQRLRTAESSRDKSHGLVQLFASLRVELSLQSSLIELTSRTRELTQTTHCTVFVVDGAHAVLRSLSSNSGEELTWPIDSSDLLQDLIARTKCPLVLQEGDARMADVWSQKNISPADGATTHPAVGSLFSRDVRNVMLVPIVADDNEVLGLIETSDKLDEEGECLSFSTDDLLIIESFARIISSRLDASDFGVMARAVTPSEAGRTADVISCDSSTKVLSNRSSVSGRSSDSDPETLVGHLPLPRRRLSLYSILQQPPVIAEGDERLADDCECAERRQ